MSENSSPLPVLLVLILAITLAFVISGDQSLEKSDLNPFGDMKQLSEVKIPILMYHYVEYNQDERDYLRDQQNVPPHIFEQQIIDLKNNGFSFITPKQIPEILKNPQDTDYVILSFDDGFKDFYTDAYPILKKHKVPAVAYIVYNFFGGLDYMTEEMIKQIVEDGLVEIGSHTLNHAYLPGIEEDLATSEISLSKSFIEEKFGIEVHSLAYPYGNYDETVVQHTKKAGYSTAVTVEPGNIVKPTELFELKRIRPGHLTGIDLINYINR